MGNLSHYTGSGNPGGGGAGDGYASEDFVAGSSSSRERKKGVPWTEEEHRMFLLGLQKLGKGDWRGIARNYVISRTPTQVASHAQKYFIRQSNVSRRKRRSSLFDIVADEAADTEMTTQEFLPIGNPDAETQEEDDVIPALPPPSLDEECESMESSNSNEGDSCSTLPPKPDPLQQQQQQQQPVYPVMYPTYFSPFIPFSLPFWPTGYSALPEQPAKEGTHEILKPTASHSKNPINVDELIGMSKLSLGESMGSSGSSSLSVKLLEGSSSGQSAFHANPTGSSSSSNPVIHAV
ncbi:unnamed protein product [Linum tenue]|uniref:Uncharacterized protein n=1 Tax=Linum tenue TaxID=586396 RepID=A0AAV0Q364_9ROSI|nr:unnamed protein product [Linum tenue]